MKNEKIISFLLALCVLMFFAGCEDGQTVFAVDTDPLLVLGGIIIMIMGIFEVASPEDAWRMANRWRFEYAEPSDLALTLTRIGGILSIIYGILLILGII
jgi:hypothetical protein